MVASRPLYSLSAYYDASAFNNESDYGNYISNCTEDYHFTPQARATTLARLRREVRNNPYLAGLVSKYPEAIGFSSLRSRTSDRKYNQAKDLFWYRWSKFVTTSGDSLKDVEELIDTELLLAGEIFIYYLANGKIQLIPSEYCGSPSGTRNSGPLAGGEVNGVVYSDAGYPIAYRFGRRNESGSIVFDREPINARFIRHVYHKDRVEMGRGLPWLLSSLRPAHDLYEITRSKTKQIKDVNAITGAIYKENAQKYLSGLEPPVTSADGTTTAEKLTDPADKPNRSGPIVIEIRPGTLIALEPGEKIERLKSEYAAGDYKELIMIMLHAISSPVGLPVELWFSGLGDVNYSGFKGLGTQWNGRRRHIISFKEEKFLGPLQFWRVSKAAKENDLPPNPDGDDDLVKWAWRRTAVLDEEKEAKANKAKLESGECSLADIWDENGYYPDEVFEERRQLWIDLLIAAGEIGVDDNHSLVEVPKSFLLRNLLPEEIKAAPSAPSPDSTSTDPGTADPSTKPSA